MEELRQCDEWADYLLRLGWAVDRLGSGYVYSKRIPILGSVTKIQRTSLDFNIQSLESLFRKRKTFFAQWEPPINGDDVDFKKYGFKIGSEPSLPSMTIQFDLTKSENEILSEMQSKTRYNIGLSKRKGVEVKESDDILLFSKLWHEAAKKRKMYLSQSKEIITISSSFQKRSKILFAYYKNSLVSGLLLISSNNVTHYMYAFSTEKGNRVHAPSLLVWESIQHSKEIGSKLFDFEGVYDERFPMKNWKGFSKFKRSFGGIEIKYPAPRRQLMWRNLV